MNSEANRNLSVPNDQGSGSPSISVVIPVYNDQQNIDRCLRSVENQDYPKERIEIIVVDDGSTDRSAEIARERNVKVLRQRHSGQGVARNKGVDEAHADIVAFIDSDDVASSSWLKEAVPFLNDGEIAAVGCSQDLLNKDNNFVKIAWLERYYRHSYSPERTNHLGGSGCIYKKSIFEEIGGFDPRTSPSEDMDLSIRVASMGYILFLIKKPLISVEYRTNLSKYMLSQVSKIAHMVMIYFKRKGTVDRIATSYTGYADQAQGLLPIAFLVSLAFLRGFQILIALGIALLILLVLNMWLMRFVFVRRNRAELGKSWPVTLLFYLFVRSLSWGGGLIYGVWLVARYRHVRYPSLT
jgi:glycosyltransferase involved in cell wall biosynthesis